MTVDTRTQFHIRRVKLGDVIETLPQYIQLILDECPLVDGYKYTLLDIKHQILKAGQSTCSTGWHTDFRSSKPTQESRELNHIWCSAAGTEYMVEGCDTILTVPTGQWFSYDRNLVHRGATVSEDMYRMFIRVSQTMERYA